MRHKSRLERILETVIRSTDKTVIAQNREIVEILEEHHDLEERRTKRVRGEEDPAWIGDPVRREYHTVGIRYGHDPDTKNSINKQHVKRRGVEIEAGLAERILEASKNPKPMYGKKQDDLKPTFAPTEALFQPGDSISFPLTVQTRRKEDLRYGTVESFRGWTEDFREIYDIKLENSGVIMTTSFRDGEAQKV